MSLLTGKHIKLRALEPEDLDFLFSAENNEDLWEFSNTQLPFSKYILKKYIEVAHQDIYEAKQYRFVICTHENTPVGMIDLFDFNPQHQRVGVGILILPKFQHKGYGSEALKMLVTYAFNTLNVHQIYANISSENEKSKILFEKMNFKKVGIKKDWIYSSNSFKNEILYQLIKNQ